VLEKQDKMRTYIFKVAIELDEDKWVAYAPELKDRGGATWGETKEEALKNLQDVIRLVLEDMAECGELPSFESEIEKKGVIISAEPLITVTV
jgi:predicted RNase H-like HicB family nuclease